MVFYKIIQDQKITDVGFVFLKWNAKRQELVYTRAGDAEFIQSSDGERVYHTAWLNRSPVQDRYPSISAIVIDREEYEQLKAQLEIDEYVEIPEDPGPAYVPPEQPDDEVETMDASKMRQIILEQKEQISMLTGCILELSEIVYGEE